MKAVTLDGVNETGRAGSLCLKVKRMCQDQEEQMKRWMEHPQVGPERLLYSSIFIVKKAGCFFFCFVFSSYVG